MLYRGGKSKRANKRGGHDFGLHLRASDKPLEPSRPFWLPGFIDAQPVRLVSSVWGCGVSGLVSPNDMNMYNTLGVDEGVRLWSYDVQGESSLPIW